VPNPKCSQMVRGYVPSLFMLTLLTAYRENNKGYL
jgi:hypothetical protein